MQDSNVIVRVVAEDAEPTNGLTLCPTDVVATPGESVVLRAAGKPDHEPRWRIRRNNGSTDVIFTGLEMDYTQVDRRYFVDGSRETEKNLVIQDVKASDAAQFTVGDDFSRQAATVNLIVIGKLSQLRRTEVL